MLEWAKFLERINLGLPMLISKMESGERYRSSLEKYKLILSKHIDRCFYCDNLLSLEKQMIHVDHFIPWSYIFEDEVWNLVLTCRDCNLRKHSSLPQQEFINNLIERNKTYSLMIEPLKRSLLKLDPDNNYESVIKRHFQNCLDYGFTVMIV